MKKRTIRATALVLALLMGLAPMAAASEALGSEIQGSTTDISVGTKLTKQIFWSDTYSDLRTERYFTYTPNRSVTPQVAYGDKLTKRATLTDMSKALEQQGKRVVGGINGDLYVLATGTPLGLVVTDGLLRSSSAGHYGIGFRGDGSAFIGSPDLAITANFQGQTLAISGGINKIRTAEGGYVLLTEDFNATTQNTVPGVDVILTPVLENVGQPVTVDLDLSPQSPPLPETSAPLTPASDPGLTPVPGASATPIPGATPVPSPTPPTTTEVKGVLTQSAQPTIGGRVTYVVDQVLESVAGIPIPAGKVVLSINAKSSYTYLIESLRALKPGDLVNVDVTSPNPIWLEAEQALGGFQKLLTGGAVEKGLSAERTAYSAVGVKADGTAVFYTIDGKQPWYSVGATLTQVAMRLAELGCVEAISLDGGGSTTIGATYPDGSAMGVINRPADGAQRANSVAIFLTTNLEPTGVLGGYYVTPADGLLLSGASLPLTAVPVDTAYYKMQSSEPLAWSIQNGDGAVSTGGIFKAGGNAGATTITATGSKAAGSATMTVVSVPDAVTLADEKTGAAITALTLSPNQVYDLKAVSVYKHLPVISQDICYRWVCDPAVGTVDANGVLTAAGKSGSGYLSATAGGKSVIIPVVIAGHVNTLQSFETGMTAFTPTSAVKLALEQTGDHVRYGSQSLRVEYDAGLTGAASVTTALSIAPGERYLNLWVYGNGSADSLTATVADAAGVTSELLLTALDTAGWKYVSVLLPTGATGVRSLNLIHGGGEQKTGTLWLDQITTSNEPLQDGVPPVVAVSVSGTALTAVITDMVDRKFTQAQLQVTYDGKPLKFTFDEAKSSLAASLPAPDGKLHRVAVLATDASGNIGRGTENSPAAPDRPPVFTDLAGHWSEPFAVYLFDQKVTSGVPNDADATLCFQPDKEITRGEFFLMVARWLGKDVSAYAATELPFADAADIPDWALGGVKAMYALGYLKGSMTDGVLKANAGSTISRAEAMTLLGRVQPRGHLSVALPFADAAQVPDWALPYVQTLVGQGVVGGFENKIMPTNPVRRGEVAKMLFTMR
ncbi:MAG: phosphodiester glycosidase family protein [Pseudoflavonifractor sp.]